MPTPQPAKTASLAKSHWLHIAYNIMEGIFTIDASSLIHQKLIYADFLLKAGGAGKTINMKLEWVSSNHYEKSH